MRKFLLLVALSILFPVLTFAQGNAFNFQGRLNDGTSPANGRYDLQFKLFDAATGGNQIGPTANRPNTVLVNGVFSVNLDFGAVAFQNPNATFIEIAVKPNGSPNPYTILGPRQQLTTVPYASRAQNSTNADSAVNAQNLAGAPASSYALKSDSTNFIRNQTTTQANTSFNISGAGVINGNLSVGGDQSFVGKQVLAGNAYQAGDKGGFVKAMVRVRANGTVAACYNGYSTLLAGNPDCGFNVIKGGPGDYGISFNSLNVYQRFVSVTPETASVNIVASVIYPLGPSSNLGVHTNITDVDYNQSAADNAFVIVVY